MEINYIKLHEDAKKCMRAVRLIINGCFAISIFVFDFLLIRDASKVAFFVIIGIVLGFAAFDCLLVPKIKYERRRYYIDDSVIRVRRGFLWISETIIPLECIHQMEVSQGPISRKFDFSDIIVTTAGGVGSIPFLKKEEAGVIVESLKEKINAIAKEERKH